MADTKKYERIDLGDPTEVALWSGALGIRGEDLQRAIADVGNAADDVVRYLLDHHLIHSASLVKALRALSAPEYA